MNLGAITNNRTVSVETDEDIVVDTIENGCNVTLFSRQGGITITNKIDQHCVVHLTAALSLSIGQKVDGQSTLYAWVSRGECNVGQKIDGQSQFYVFAGNAIRIGQKIDGSSIAGLYTGTESPVTFGQKIDGGSQVDIYCGGINIAQQAGGKSRVTYLANQVSWGSDGVTGGATVTKSSGSRFSLVEASSSFFEVENSGQTVNPQFSLAISGYLLPSGELIVIPGYPLFFAQADDTGAGVAYRVVADILGNGGGSKNTAGQIALPLTLFATGWAGAPAMAIAAGQDQSSARVALTLTTGFSRSPKGVFTLEGAPVSASGALVLVGTGAFPLSDGSSVDFGVQLEGTLELT